MYLQVTVKCHRNVPMLCEVCLDLIEAVHETFHVQLHHDDNVTAMIACSGRKQLIFGSSVTLEDSYDDSEVKRQQPSDAADERWPWVHNQEEANDLTGAMMLRLEWYLQ